MAADASEVNGINDEKEKLPLLLNVLVDSILGYFDGSSN